MSSKNGHWVEELFPPTFQYSAENFNLKDEKYGSVNSQQKRVLLTAENIQDIYQQVNSLALAGTNSLKKEEQTKQSEQGLPAMALEKDLPKSHGPEVIWTVEELNIFRKEFCSLKKENSQLHVKVKELEKYCKNLEELSKSLLKGSESMKTKLDDFKKANKRQTIHNDILKSELKTATSAIETLHQMNVCLMEEKDNLLKKSSELQVQLNKERIEKLKLNQSLESAKSDFSRELICEQESLRNAYEVKINSLKDERDDAVTNYAQERDQHISTKHGLQELLRHFSSLTETAGSIKKDQLHSLK